MVLSLCLPLSLSDFHYSNPLCSVIYWISLLLPRVRYFLILDNVHIGDLINGLAELELVRLDLIALWAN